jgi:hypothetical protein
MKKVLISLLITSLLLIAVIAFADKSLPVFKKGDSVYVCSCGDSCDCKTVSRKEGKCSCGSPLAKGIVSKVDGSQLIVTAGDKVLVLPAKAKYTCACGDGCKCGTISQKPGKCSCGSEMKKVD